MHQPGERPRSRSAAVIRRRRLAALAVAAALMAAAGWVVVALSDGREGSARSADRAGVLRLTASGRVVARIDLAPIASSGRLDGVRLRRAVVRALPRRSIARRGRATIVYGNDRLATARRALTTKASGGRVEIARRALSASVRAPVLRQAQRNTCESAALEILTATVGRRVAQARLQAAFPRSGGLDPIGAGNQRVWGDPELGYVGRPDGGGVAGGFGVYPRPVRQTAARFGVRLDDVSGQPPSSVYRRLLQGRAVMVWIGLSDGPYGEWRSPSGARVRVNFGEHTVVLHGLRADGRLRVSNPLQGTAEVWTQDDFELMWRRLGRRALST